MKKVAIISNYSVKYGPYLKYYAGLLSANGIEPIIISKEPDLSFVEKENHFALMQSSDFLKQNALKRTYAWYKFLIKTLKQQHCDKLIVAPTRTAIMLTPLLLLKRKKYLFDIRDYTGEGSAKFRILEKILLDNAGLNVISSDGFRKWLPETSTKTCTIHNMPYDAKPVPGLNGGRNGTPITIAYIGMVNYFKTNKALIDALADEPGYRLQYSGSLGEACELDKYVESISPSNVFFTGAYKNEQKGELHTGVDMLNAVYGNDSLIVTTALPNKLYDAIIYRKPIIASKGTYLGEVIEKNGLGLAIDTENDDIKQVLDDYWNRFDAEKFYADCDAFFTVVKKQQLETEKAIIDFCVGR